MTKRDEVIETLKEIADYFRVCRANESFNSDAETRYWRMQSDVIAVIDLLREQEPVKPIPPEPDGLYHCGNCGQVLFRCNDKFCPVCGKKVAWDA